MGLEQTVTFEGGRVPPWPAVRDLLAGQGFPVQVRMIDGELSLPEEEPPETWREIRLGTSQGMVTLRRGPDWVAVVTWGNADEPLLQAWNALAWALAEAGGGRILAADRPQSAGEFRDRATLPESLRPPRAGR